jgi:hypothetical protein
MLMTYASSLYVFAAVWGMVCAVVVIVGWGKL